MKPNLLFIYTDQQAYNTLAAYGNKEISMPNLDRLAEESTVFNECYVTQPVCTPSRSTLLTGLYPHTNGCTENNIPLSADTPCLPEMITDKNYVTAHYGKWHLGDELYAQHGFQHWIGIEDNYNKYFSDDKDKNIVSDYHQFLVENGFKPRNGDRFKRGETAKFPEKYSKPAFLAEESSKFIQENKSNPFILYINFLEPHSPYSSPRNNQYDPDKISLPENFENIPDSSKPLKTRLFQEYYKKHGRGIDLSDEKGWRRLRANYYGLCSLIDTYVGKVLDTLEECNLKNNTIIVFTSDHGDLMGSHQLVTKCVMFQEAIRVPLMIHLPGKKNRSE